MAAATVGENWGPGDVLTLEVTADFSAAKGKIVALTISGPGKVELATDADSTSVPPFGVCVENAFDTATSGNLVAVVPIASGKRVKVLCDGSGTAVDEGSYLTTNASSLGIVTTTAGDVVIGQAMGATSDASAFIVVQLGNAVQYALA